MAFGLSFADPIASFSTPQLSLAFIVQTATNIIGGSVAGLIYDRLRDEDVYRPHLWVQTIRDQEPPLKAQIVTQSGTELIGQITKYDRTEGTPALLLDNVDILEEPQGTVLFEQIDGKVYLSEDDISYIWIN